MIQKLLFVWSRFVATCNWCTMLQTSFVACRKSICMSDRCRPTQCAAVSRLNSDVENPDDDSALLARAFVDLTDNTEDSSMEPAPVILFSKLS